MTKENKKVVVGYQRPSFFRRIVNEFRYGVKRFPLWAGSGGTLSWELTKYKYADAVLLAILKKLVEGLVNTEYSLISGNKKKFLAFQNIFEDNVENILIRLIIDGTIYFKEDASSLEVIEDKFSKEADARLDSISMKLMNKSDQQILKDLFQHIDNILNAVSTSVKRLGSLTILTPEDPMHNPLILDEQEMKEYEEDLSKDYGVLDNQTPIKIMRRKFNVNTISLAGATLRTNENLQTAVKIVCDTLEIPYEVMASAIVGNPNQTGVYQEQAVVRLYNTVEKYVNIFVKFARSVGLEVEYNILTKPRAEEKTEWETKALILDTVMKAVSNVYMTPEQAQEIINLKFELTDGTEGNKNIKK